MEYPVELIAVGKIVNTHGVKGYVKVFPLTDNLERFCRLSKVLLVLGEYRREEAIDQVRLDSHKNNVYLLFKGITDKSLADPLKNSLIMIPKSQLVPLPENTYYHFQLIGLQVYLQEGAYLGKIKQILETGANDVYLVENEPGDKPILIPALKSIVKEIDLEQGKMIVDPPPGLLDI
jgi:16S rRNA processing protein RimM